MRTQYFRGKKKYKINLGLIKRQFMLKKDLNLKCFKLKFREMLKLGNSQNAKARDYNSFPHTDI